MENMTLYYPPIGVIDGKVLHHDELNNESWKVTLRGGGYLFSVKIEKGNIASLTKRRIVSHEIRICCGLPDSINVVGEMMIDEILKVASLPYEIFCTHCRKYGHAWGEKDKTCEHCGSPAEWHVEKKGMFRRYVPIPERSDVCIRKFFNGEKVII